MRRSIHAALTCPTRSTGVRSPGSSTRARVSTRCAGTSNRPPPPTTHRSSSGNCSRRSRHAARCGNGSDSPGSARMSSQAESKLTCTACTATRASCPRSASPPAANPSRRGASGPGMGLNCTGSAGTGEPRLTMACDRRTVDAPLAVDQGRLSSTLHNGYYRHTSIEPVFDIEPKCGPTPRPWPGSPAPT
jgi:hypothetical protein